VQQQQGGKVAIPDLDGGSMKKGTQTNGKGSKPRPYDVKRYDAGRKGIKWDSEKRKKEHTT
tara:strand:+ start:2019 stop:2201 length:183 start_codon:yes stop_codon:yes gene_type:complete